MEGPYKKLVSIFHILIQGVLCMILIRPTELNAMLVQTFMEDGTETMSSGPRNFYLDLAMPYFMLGAQYYGQANCKREFY